MTVMAEKSAGGTATRTRLLQGSLTPGDSPRLALTRFEDWLAIHQPERSFS
jgi:hypothetical protein